MTEQTSHLAHALADAAVVDKGMLRPHRPTTPHIAGRYTFGLVSRFPRQPLAQDDRHSSTPRNGDCAIVSWRSPSDSFADNNLCYYPPDQSRDRLDNRSPEPISGKSQSRATPTIQKCPGHRNLHNYRRSGFRIVRASSSRCCAGEFRCRYESGSTLLILPEFCSRSSWISQTAYRHQAPDALRRKCSERATARPRPSNFRPAARQSSRRIADHSCRLIGGFLPWPII